MGIMKTQSYRPPAAAKQSIIRIKGENDQAFEAGKTSIQEAMKSGQEDESLAK